ncbi:hypothetical protein RF11_09562 [Thelohanellus kitauei]|uniref:Uncharacterized protein n=1 Tax=Thelohanellus kitauei TaxID=669202 RepID=A0A0C2N489_THEKT|nr:hypothetical protein RF11_09562 [Thelohanellus kitauei]
MSTKQSRYITTGDDVSVMTYLNLFSLLQTHSQRIDAHSVINQQITQSFPQPGYAYYLVLQLKPWTTTKPSTDHDDQKTLAEHELPKEEDIKPDTHDINIGHVGPNTMDIPIEPTPLNGT